jgi:protein SFI1
MFSKWLNSARAARHRRMTLQLKEEEMERSRVIIAWENWRERFLGIKLQPTVSNMNLHYFRTFKFATQADNFIIQRQQNLVFYAFGLWHSKTRVSCVYFAQWMLMVFLVFACSEIPCFAH